MTIQDDTEQWERAADAAGAAALLEIGDRLGLLPRFDQGQQVRVEELAEATGLPATGVAGYLEALCSAGLIEEVAEGSGAFQTVAGFSQIRYESGYLSWALNANRPFVDHAVDFFHDARGAGDRHRRDGRQVAVSSEWMGSFGFYPVALKTILDARPARVVDLGAGTGRLVIEILLSLTDSTGVALDLDTEACAEARLAGDRAGVGDRLTVVERPIQSVATDPGPVEGTDVIHAGFVFHDMMPEEEEVADSVLANCREALAPGGMMAITEAVPYVRNARERRFSAIVTYYHQQFMRRRLLNEREWQEKLSSAGFSDVQCVSHRFPTGRLFVAIK
ncbi:class I SAM-dependent methyltransferase [Actinomadura sp. NTSP31]|uniref:class I SAM-dependent methyltransferase n=1 Tax=Actinomadura sp. NTSP31 TaxID=1735447 RepID=UPI0035BFA7A1